MEVCAMRSLLIIITVLTIAHSFARLSFCGVEFYDIWVKDYSYPRDIFYINIKYPDGKLLGYDPNENKFIGYKEIETIDVEGKKGETPSWPLFENQKKSYEYIDFKGRKLTKYAPLAWEEEKDKEGKYITGYFIDCIEGTNIVKVIPREPAIVSWNAKMFYSAWTDNEVILSYFSEWIEPPEGLSGTFMITPEMGQREMVFYVDPDYKKIRIDFKVNPEMLMQSLNGCAQLGLIKNRGILNSLLSKLENADRQYKMGNVSTAKNIIRAFSNELSALEGKQIDKECVSALQMDIKAFLGVNIVQEGLEKFIKESGSSRDIIQLQSVKSEGKQTQGNSLSSSKKGLGCSMGSTSSAVYVLGWLLLPVFVFVKRFRKL
jgi:hypothetical protein